MLLVPWLMTVSLCPHAKIAVCLQVMMGDGWSARMDDATLHGCIPVIIMASAGMLLFAASAFATVGR